MRLLLSVCLLCFPTLTYGAVIINEIAWMGSPPDFANDEWIELYNTGDSSVTVDGWRVTDGASLDIALSGNIPAKTYAVLERTDDQSAPGSAFLVYTGSLVNTGATLSLFRSDATLEDQVAGGTDWGNIGGDNTTKQTPQYTSSGWVTADATPGGPVGTIPDPDPDDEEENEVDEDSTPVTQSQKAGVTIELKVPNVDLALRIQSPDIVAINQPVPFIAIASGIGDTALNSLTYEWNFGDLSTSSSKETTHTFAMPGEYVVTVFGTFARHEQIARKTITVLPVHFELSVQSNGDVLIHNNAKYEIDMSGYVLKGQKRIVFPQNTIVLGNATIRVPKSKLGTAQKSISLYDQENVKVATLALIPLMSSQQTLLSSVVPSMLPKIAVGVQKAIAPSTPQKQSNFSFETEAAAKSTTTTTTTSLKLEQTRPEAGTLFASASQGTAPKSALPYLGLCGVLSLGILALFAGKRS
jgi:hypothetical protein